MLIGLSLESHLCSGYDSRRVDSKINCICSRIIDNDVLCRDSFDAIGIGIPLDNLLSGKID